MQSTSFHKNLKSKTQSRAEQVKGYRAAFEEAQRIEADKLEEERRADEDNAELEYQRQHRQSLVDAVHRWRQEVLANSKRKDKKGMGL